MFSLQIVRGSGSLSEPASILLSSSGAKAFFGSEDPLNKLVKIDDHDPVKVTGVYKDFPHNSSFADLNFISTWDFYYSLPDGVKGSLNFFYSQ